jgi:heat shock protein HslJ
MKTIFRVIIPAGLALLLSACASSAPPREEVVDFSSLMEKDWVLTEIRKPGGGAVLDRAAMEADGLGSAFTLRFEAERVSGQALPNRYFGPYHRDGHNLSLGELASTLMASLLPWDGPTETEYLGLLRGVQSWAWDQGKLVLTATTEGQGAVLIFSLPEL